MSSSIKSSAVSQFRQSLSQKDWWVLGSMTGFVLLLHIVGWGVLFGVIEPAGLDLDEGKKFGIALGVTAYVLGMRHAFDADHIAAIDNTTRKLVGEGKKPLSVGFWFSLGHSSIVFGLCLMLAFGIRSIAGQVENEDSTLQFVTGIIGTAVSGTFLLLLGIVNLVSLKQILKVRSELKKGQFSEDELEEHLNQRGLINRILRPVMKLVGKPRHMYPVGFLFGLGFDTATEVSLLVLAASSAAFELPWYAIMVLPILFAAGMSLLDTIDGVFMNFAYSWACSRPVRKVYYNIIITGLSAMVALIIGVIEIISIMVDRLKIESGIFYTIGNLNLNHVGYLIVGLFVVTWTAALVWWRMGKVEERWGAQTEISLPPESALTSAPPS